MGRWARVYVLVGAMLLAIVIIFSPSRWFSWIGTMAIAPLTYVNLVLGLCGVALILGVLFSGGKTFARSPQWLMPIYRAGFVGFGLSILYRNLVFPFRPDERLALIVSFAGLACSVAALAAIIRAKAFARR